jgi:hypothetical protein
LRCFVTADLSGRTRLANEPLPLRRNRPIFSLQTPFGQTLRYGRQIIVRRRLAISRLKVAQGSFGSFRVRLLTRQLAHRDRLGRRIQGDGAILSALTNRPGCVLREPDRDQQQGGQGQHGEQPPLTTGSRPCARVACRGLYRIRLRAIRNRRMHGVTLRDGQLGSWLLSQLVGQLPSRFTDRLDRLLQLRRRRQLGFERFALVGGKLSENKRGDPRIKGIEGHQNISCWWFCFLFPRRQRPFPLRTVAFADRRPWLDAP